MLHKGAGRQKYGVKLYHVNLFWHTPLYKIINLKINIIFNKEVTRFHVFVANCVEPFIYSLRVERIKQRLHNKSM